MNKLALFSSLVALHVSAAFAQTEYRPLPPDTQITFQRTPCAAACQIYKVVVNSDGRVEYEGSNRVQRIPVIKVKNAVEEFMKIGFFSLRDRYADKADGCNEVEPGMAGVRMSLRLDGNFKEVFHDLGCKGPVILTTLVDFENRLAQLIGSDNESVPNR